MDVEVVVHDVLRQQAVSKLQMKQKYVTTCSINTVQKHTYKFASLAVWFYFGFILVGLSILTFHFNFKS